jgi:hypothetical protein
MLRMAARKARRRLRRLGTAYGRSCWRLARFIHSTIICGLAEPVLLEIQQRDQQIFEYLSGDSEQQIAS